jgi:methionyl-tRNA formyltransferase
VVGVVTAPDKPSGRGYGLTSPAVKVAAQALGLPVFQPESLKDPLFQTQLKQLGPVDLGLVVAYGKLIPRDIFSIPQWGLVNVHFSLLPRYRGAGPVQWALIRGEEETGVSLFRIDEGLDMGPLYLQGALPILPEDDVLSLRERLVKRGLELTETLLSSLGAKPPFEPTPQVGEPSLAPLLMKEDGRVRWSLWTAFDAANRVRGTAEWPGASTHWQGKLLKIRRAEPRQTVSTASPGEVLALEKDKGFLVKCLSGALLVTRVQPEGKREMTALDFWNGFRLKPGNRFQEVLP